MGPPTDLKKRKIPRTPVTAVHASTLFRRRAGITSRSERCDGGNPPANATPTPNSRMKAIPQPTEPSKRCSNSGQGSESPAAQESGTSVVPTVNRAMEMKDGARTTLRFRRTRNANQQNIAMDAARDRAAYEGGESRARPAPKEVSPPATKIPLTTFVPLFCRAATRLCNLRLPITPRHATFDLLFQATTPQECSPPESMDHKWSRAVLGNRHVSLNQPRPHFRKVEQSDHDRGSHAPEPYCDSLRPGGR
jgi:hypothetical protein